MSTRSIGNEYEEEAVKALINAGYDIIDRNFYSKNGELDIVAMNEDYLCFVEVRFKSSAKHGHPAESVDLRKQKRIIQTARYYLYTNGFTEDTPCRFDVVSISDDELNIIKDAFQL